MHIAKLTIKNYRNFQNFSIDLKPLTLIIGENNAGKSNLLDSIGLLFSQDVSFFKKRTLETADFNYEVIREFKQKVLDFTLSPEKIDYPTISVEAILKGWNEDQETVISDWFGDNTMTFAKLTYIFEPMAKFDRIEEIVRQRNFIEEKIDSMSEPDFQALPENIRMDLVNFPISRYQYTIYGGKNRTVQANPYFLSKLKFELLDALRDASSELVASQNNKLLFRILNSREDSQYQELKAQLVGLQQAIDANLTLQGIKKGISEQLEKISLSKDGTTNIVDLLFSLPNVIDLLKKISIIYGANPIKIERNGTGRNNLLFISLILSFIEDAEIAHNSYFRVVGIEEPEAHLHPNLQDHLAHNIEKLIRKEGDVDFRKDIQLLITSHSTHITTKIDFNHTVVIYEHDGKVRPHYIFDGFATNAVGKKQIRYLNKYLDAINTNIFYSQRIVLVEGISEKLLVPKLFQIATGTTTEKNGCCVINVNGLAFRNFLEIIRNGYFQKCLVLTDLDTGTRIENRADTLKAEYSDVPQIQIAVTSLSTFEKDIILANLSGKGRDILLDALLEARPEAGAAYKKLLGNDKIEIDPFFKLIEGYKSAFAYCLLIRLEESSTGFAVPGYIQGGIEFLTRNS